MPDQPDSPDATVADPATVDTSELADTSELTVQEADLAAAEAFDAAPDDEPAAACGAHRASGPSSTPTPGTRTGSRPTWRPGCRT